MFYEYDTVSYLFIKYYFSTLTKNIKSLTIRADGEFVDLDTEFENVRIRRITGYLVGTLDRFNDGKRAEVEDRVKHGV